MICKADGAVVGEIGCSLDSASNTARVGLLVEPLAEQLYDRATLTLLTYLLVDVGVPGVAETLVDHVASRRVMEKAGMSHCGERAGEEDGQTVQLVVYEAPADAHTARSVVAT
jgi:hypothetical protein